MSTSIYRHRYISIDYINIDAVVYLLSAIAPTSAYPASIFRHPLSDVDMVQTIHIYISTWLPLGVDISGESVSASNDQHQYMEASNLSMIIEHWYVDIDMATLVYPVTRYITTLICRWGQDYTTSFDIKICTTSIMRHRLYDIDWHRLYVSVPTSIYHIDLISIYLPCVYRHRHITSTCRHRYIDIKLSTLDMASTLDRWLDIFTSGTVSIQYRSFEWVSIDISATNVLCMLCCLSK
jgi:hypothetical protein